MPIGPSALFTLEEAVPAVLVLGASRFIPGEHRLTVRLVFALHPVAVPPPWARMCLQVLEADTGDAAFRADDARRFLFRSQGVLLAGAIMLGRWRQQSLNGGGLAVQQLMSHEVLLLGEALAAGAADNQAAVALLALARVLLLLRLQEDMEEGPELEGVPCTCVCPRRWLLSARMLV